MDTFDRISALLKEHGMTQADLSRATGISTGLISQWKKRMQQPSSEKLKAIADYFGISVDWLLTGIEDKKELTAHKDSENIIKLNEISNPDIKMIARAGEKMTKDQAKMLRKYAQFMFPEAFEDDD